MTARSINEWPDAYFLEARALLIGKLTNWRPASDVRAGSYADMLPHLRLCDPFFDFSDGSAQQAYSRFGDAIFAEAAVQNPVLGPVLTETRALWDWRLAQKQEAHARAVREDMVGQIADLRRRGIL